MSSRFWLKKYGDHRFTKQIHRWIIFVLAYICPYIYIGLIRVDLDQDFFWLESLVKIYSCLITKYSDYTASLLHSTLSCFNKLLSALSSIDPTQIDKQPSQFPVNNNESRHKHHKLLLIMLQKSTISNKLLQMYSNFRLWCTILSTNYFTSPEAAGVTVMNSCKNFTKNGRRKVWLFWNLEAQQMEGQRAIIIKIRGESRNNNIVYIIN